MRFTVLKCTVQWISVYSQGYATVTTDSRMFSSLKRNAVPISSHSPFAPTPSSWQPPTCCVSIDLSIVNISYKWKHSICDPGVWLLTEHNIWGVGKDSSIDIGVLHSFSWLNNIPLNRYTSLFVHLAVQGQLGRFHFQVHNSIIFL